MNHDEVRVDAVNAGARPLDEGFIPSLVSSIEQVGLLSPIGVSPDNTLLYGAHRLEAAKRLGWERIPVVVISTVRERLDYLRVERDENAVRRTLKPTEAATLYAEILAAEKLEAARRRGSRTDLKTSAEIPHKSGRAKSEAAIAVSGSAGKSYTLDKVLKVQELVESDTTPEPVREIAREALAEMDETGKVDAAHKKVKTAATAAELVAEFPDLAFYVEKGDPETAITLGNVIKACDEPKRTARLNALRATVSAERRKQHQPAEETGPDYTALADLIFVAFNNALQVASKQGGAETIRAAVETANPLAVELWRSQFERIQTVASELLDATRPVLRRVQ